MNVNARLVVKGWDLEKIIKIGRRKK